MADQNDTNMAVERRLASIETKVDILLTQGTPQCSNHEQQIRNIFPRVEKIEASLGQQHLVRISLTAIGVGIGAGLSLALKALK